MTTIRTRARAAGLLAAITMTAALAACSSSDFGGDIGGGSGGDSGGDSGGGAVSDTSSQGEAAPAERGSSSDGGARSSADDASGAGTGSQGPTTPDMERSVISSGTVSLTSSDVAETRREVQRVVDARGGEITEETTDTDEDGEASYSRLVVRVPSAEFGETMTALEQAGVLRTSSRGSEDVTTQVIDTGVRVRAQEASLKRVELLLADAEDLKDIIWIESQLTSRQAELDSMKSQQSWLEDQTSLSTITVDISTDQSVVEEDPDDAPAGFLAGLRGGTDALMAVLAAVTTIVGALLPFAVVALVVGVPVWLLVRRRRAGGAPADSPADAPAA